MDTSVCRSIGYRRIESGALSLDGCAPDLLRFKRAFERDYRNYGIPLYAVCIGERYVRYIHYVRGVDLQQCEWDIIVGLACEAMRRIGVELLWMPDDPSLWVLCGA